MSSESGADRRLGDRSTAGLFASRPKSLRRYSDATLLTQLTYPSYEVFSRR